MIVFFLCWLWSSLSLWCICVSSVCILDAYTPRLYDSLVLWTSSCEAEKKTIHAMRDQTCLRIKILVSWWNSFVLPPRKFSAHIMREAGPPKARHERAVHHEHARAPNRNIRVGQVHQDHGTQGYRQGWVAEWTCWRYRPSCWSCQGNSFLHYLRLWVCLRRPPYYVRVCAFVSWVAVCRQK